MKKQVITLCFYLLVLCSNAQAQNMQEPRTYPVWIEMMSDPAANYFDAVKAFELYWQDKMKPLEEDEAENKKSSNRSTEKQERKYKKQLALTTVAQRNEFDRINY